MKDSSLASINFYGDRFVCVSFPLARRCLCSAEALALVTVLVQSQDHLSVIVHRVQQKEEKIRYLVQVRRSLSPHCESHAYSMRSEEEIRWHLAEYGWIRRMEELLLRLTSHWPIYFARSRLQKSTSAARNVSTRRARREGKSIHHRRSISLPRCRFRLSSHLNRAAAETVRKQNE